MRLRNRQTGKIYTLSDDLYIEYTQGGKIELRAIIPGGNMSYYYDSLDKLNEEWEDYEPAEPLIKDEKIRKAVRAWADVNELSSALVYHSFFDTFLTFKSGVKIISFQVETPKELEFGKTYTITELCGEEEE